MSSSYSGKYNNGIIGVCYITNLRRIVRSIIDARLERALPISDLGV